MSEITVVGLVVLTSGSIALVGIMDRCGDLIAGMSEITVVGTIVLTSGSVALAAVRGRGGRSDRRQG